MKARKNEETIENEKSYRQLIGKLLYTAVNTNSGIKASVLILSQHNIGEIEKDWNEAKRIARYLKGTKELKLKLGNNNVKDKDTLIDYADADWA